jgi:hypothetical protein
MTTLQARCSTKDYDEVLRVVELTGESVSEFVLRWSRIGVAFETGLKDRYVAFVEAEATLKASIVEALNTVKPRVVKPSELNWMERLVRAYTMGGRDAATFVLEKWVGAKSTGPDDRDRARSNILQLIKQQHPELAL